MNDESKDELIDEYEYEDDWEDDWEDEDEEDQAPRRYHTLSAPAVASLVFGVLSAATVADWTVAVVPMVGIILGFVALRRIKKKPEIMTGRGLARAGIILSVLLWTVGYGWQLYARRSECPHGYTRISFDTLQPDPDKPHELIPPAILDLEPSETDPAKMNQKVFIKGYMYPGRRTIGIRQFIMVPTMGHCQFCSSILKSTDMVFVRFQGDLAPNFTNNLVAVGGKLRVDQAQAARAFGGLPYVVEADYFQ